MTKRSLSPEELLEEAHDYLAGAELFLRSPRGLTALRAADPALKKRFRALTWQLLGVIDHALTEEGKP